MDTRQQPDQETASTEIASSEPTKARRSFGKVRRELSDDELSSPAVQKLLLDDIERLERENRTLEPFRDKFTSISIECAVLKERLRSNTSAEFLYGLCLALGSIALGYTPTLWSKQPEGYLSLAFGVLLVIGGIFTKVKLK